MIVFSALFITRTWQIILAKYLFMQHMVMQQKKQQNESESLWLLPANGFFTSEPNELVDSNYTIPP